MCMTILCFISWLMLRPQKLLKTHLGEFAGGQIQLTKQTLCSCFSASFLAFPYVIKFFFQAVALLSSQLHFCTCRTV